MSREHHYLKTETAYYQEVERGRKKFEVRINDRNFKIGDMLYLRETVNGNYTGRELPPLEIQYVLEGGKFGIAEGYCVLNW